MHRLIQIKKARRITPGASKVLKPLLSINKKTPKERRLSSGWQDSNLRPPAPKAGAMTGLRYTPLFLF